MILPDVFNFKISGGSENVIYEAKRDNQSQGYLLQGGDKLSAFLPDDFVKENINKENWVIIQNGEDIINKPSHYHKNAIDVVGYLEQHFPLEGKFTVSEGFYIGNAIKYVSRYKEKNGLEDLEKAAFYLGKLIDIEKTKIGGE